MDELWKWKRTSKSWWDLENYLCLLLMFILINLLYVYSCAFKTLKFFSNLQNKLNKFLLIGLFLVNSIWQDWRHLQHWSSTFFSEEIFYSEWLSLHLKGLVFYWMNFKVNSGSSFIFPWIKGLNVRMRL